MGFFSKIFGSKENKEQEVQPVENKTVPVEEKPVEKPVEEPAKEEVETPAEEPQQKTVAEEPKSAETKTASSNNAGQVDLSKWRIAPNGEDGTPEFQQGADGTQQMQVLLKCDMGDEESLTDDRRKALVEQVFKGPEGVKLFGQDTLIENIFLISYMQNVMVPKAHEANNQNDLAVFSNLIGLYSRMFVAKITRLEKWVAIGSQVTGFPFEMGKMALVLVQDKYADEMVDIMSNQQNYKVGKNEIAHEHFSHFADFLRRCGYAGIAISDGRHPGVAIPLDLFFTGENEPKIGQMENPLLMGAMISFMQEIRRGIDVNTMPAEEQEGYKQVLSRMQGQMFYQIANADFVVPTKKDEQGRELNPSFQNPEGTERMLAVFTDVQEMDGAFPMRDGWISIPTPFDRIVDMINSNNGAGFVINSASISVPVPKDMMNHIAQMKASEEESKKKNEETQN